MITHESTHPSTAMKRIVRRVQSLNERAAELTAAAGQMPNRVAELRQAVTATSSELQNLKNGIEVNITDLQMNREDDLSAALTEVAAHAPVLAEAGFILDGLDVEVSPVQRIIVQLVRYDDVETLEIQALIQKYQQEKSVRAILSSILKARAMVETVHIDGLDYHKLTVGIGPVPTIRLCWRDTATEVGSASPSPAKPATSQTASPDTLQTSFFGAPPAFSPMAGTETDAVAVAGPEAAPGETSGDNDNDAETTPAIHESHASNPPQTVATPPPLPAIVPAPTPAPPPLPPPSTDPLAKFKVMPNLDRR